MRFSGRNGWSGRCAAVLCFVSAAGVAAAGDVFFQGQVNGRVQGFAHTDLSDFRAETGRERFYTELWFHEMQFVQEGLIVIVNVQMHNLGVSRGYCDSYISVSGPDGVLHLDKDSFKPREVRIDPEGFGVSFGPNRIELEGDLYTIRYQGRAIQANLTYRILTPSFRQGDGTVRFEGDDQFVRFTFPIPWAEVSGSLAWAGRTVHANGMGSMNHDRQVLSPRRFMNRWRVGWFYGTDATVSLTRCTSPDLGGRWVQRLMVAERGRILFSSHDFRYEEFDPLPVPGTPIACPGRTRVEAEHGGDRLTGTWRVQRIQERKEILSDYPTLFRQLARIITEETWSYRCWVDFDFELHRDGKTRKIAGTGTANFIEPVPAGGGGNR